MRRRVLRATVRIKVQLLFLLRLRALAFAAPAGAAEYTVVTCNGQAAANGGWALYASGPEHRAVGELRGLGRVDGRRAGRQPGARRVERRVAGLRARQHEGRRRDALPARSPWPGRATGTWRAGSRPPRPTTRCSRTARARAAASRRSRAARSRGARPAPTSTGSRSTSSASEPCQKLSGGEAAAVRLSRADIALTDNAAPTITAGPSSAMFGVGRAGERGAEHRRDLQGRRRRRGGDGHRGRRQTVSETPVPTAAVARPTGGSCRAR